MRSTILVVAGVASCLIGTAGAIEPFSKKAWSEDFDVLIEQLEARHPAPYHAISRDQFIKRLNAAEKHAQRSLNSRDAVAEIARTIAMLGETHTYLNWPDADDKIPFRRYPFRARKFGDGVFIADADDRYGNLIGAQILAFGDRPIDDVLSDIRTVTGADNEWTHDVIGPWRLTLADLMAVLGAAEENGNLRIAARRPDGETVSTVVSAADEAPSLPDMRDKAALAASLYWRDPETPYWHAYLPDKHVIYFQFNSVSEREDESIAAYAERLGGDIASRRPDRVIVDLRRNIGGNSKIARPILREIISSDAARMQGGVVVLIGPSTISAAVVIGEELSHFADVVFIGEPTGSNRNQWGDNTFFELPNSGISISTSTMLYQTGGPYAPHGPILPDFYVPVSSADYFALNDKALDAAFAYAPEPSLAAIYDRAVDNGDDPVAAVRRFTHAPQYRFQDFERPLRRLAGRVSEAGDAAAALNLAGLLVERHPDRARSFMAKAEQLEAAGRIDEAVEYWRRGRDAIDQDPSLYPELAKALKGYVNDKITGLEAQSAK